LRLLNLQPLPCQDNKSVVFRKTNRLIEYFFRCHISSEGLFRGAHNFGAISGLQFCLDFGSYTHVIIARFWLPQKSTKTV